MPNSREGFEQFVKMTEGLKAKHGLTDVLIGLEPTGHYYWKKFAYFAKGHGYEVRFVRTMALKHHRALGSPFGVSLWGQAMLWGL
jgi:transposase